MRLDSRERHSETRGFRLIRSKRQPSKAPREGFRVASGGDGMARRRGGGRRERAGSTPCSGCCARRRAMGTARQASLLGLPCSLSSFLWNSVYGMRSSLSPFCLPWGSGHRGVGGSRGPLRVGSIDSFLRCVNTRRLWCVWCFNESRDVNVCGECAR